MPSAPAPTSFTRRVTSTGYACASPSITKGWRENLHRQARSILTHSPSNQKAENGPSLQPQCVLLVQGRQNLPGCRKETFFSSVSSLSNLDLGVAFNEGVRRDLEVERGGTLRSVKNRLGMHASVCAVLRSRGREMHRCLPQPPPKSKCTLGV